MYSQTTKFTVKLRTEVQSTTDECTDLCTDCDRLLRKSTVKLRTQSNTNTAQKCHSKYAARLRELASCRAYLDCHNL